MKISDKLSKEFLEQYNSISINDTSYVGIQSIKINEGIDFKKVNQIRFYILFG